MRAAELLVRCPASEGVQEGATDNGFLKEGFASPVPCVVDVPVDYRENLRLAERMGQLVCPI